MHIKLNKSRRERIKEGKKWFASQQFMKEDDILREYRKRFQVDSICAKRDLCAMGVLDSETRAKYEKSLEDRNRHMEKKRMRQRKREEWKSENGDLMDQDENFYFIAGYTSGGAPYGITWEEAERDGLLADENDMHAEEDLPF